MSRNPRLYLSDILESIKKIEQYTASLTFEQFGETSIVIDAVARNLEIIGEASSHVLEEIREKHPQVPWYKMKAMLNIMAHEYHRVDLRIVWETAQKDLPIFKSQIPTPDPLVSACWDDRRAPILVVYSIPAI
ncbi:MAG: DUF86 domain-containing protein, partial [Clostridiaceae bacterium]|nr:DUF86 domain-containing protein [Clostridiaceae bacterium]